MATFPLSEAGGIAPPALVALRRPSQGAQPVQGDSASATLLPAHLRQLADRYDIAGELGRGGMATVYLAYERATARAVAIKVMNRNHAADPAAARRFAREARTVATLRHPNIIETIAVEEIGSSELAIVSAHVQGQTLRDALRTDGAFPVERVLRVLREISAALAHAHARRVVHRDVKPANIFLESGTDRALLADFGIARALDDNTVVTMADFAIGTPAYMAPELIAGHDVNERADVYALGLLGWEMLIGRPPWQGETLYSMLHKQQHEELPDLAMLRPDIPVFLYRALSVALSKDPGSRWRDAAEFAAQLSPAPALPDDTGSDVADAANDATLYVERPHDTATLNQIADVFGEILRADFMRADPSLVMDTDEEASGEIESVGVERDMAEWREDDEPAWPAGPVGTVGPRHDAMRAPSIADPVRRGRRLAPAVVTVAGIAAFAAMFALPGAGSHQRSGVDPQLDTLLTQAAVLPAVARAGTSARTPAGTGGVRLASTPAGTVAAPPLVAGNVHCASPSTAEQRACLFDLIHAHEASLTRAYGALITAHRRATGQREPPSVRALRAEERAWIAARDRACRVRTLATEGTYWGVARAPCFAEMTDVRTAELRRRAAVRPRR